MNFFYEEVEQFCGSEIIILLEKLNHFAEMDNKKSIELIKKVLKDI